MKWQNFLTATASALVLTACSTTRQGAPTAPVTAHEAENEKPQVAVAVRTDWGPERDPEIRRLLKERFDAAVNIYEAEKKKLESGKSTIYSLSLTSRALAEAELELAETPEQVFAARESELKRCTNSLAETAKRMEVGSLSPLDQKMVEADCITARIDLLRAKRNFQKDERTAWGAIRAKTTSSAVFPPAWTPERDPDIRRRLEERYHADVAALEAEHRKLESGKSTSFTVVAFVRIVAKAEVELADTPEQVIAALESELKSYTALLAEDRKRLDVGTITPLDQMAAEAACSAARINLLRAKRHFQKNEPDSEGATARKTPDFAPFLAAWVPERDPEIRRMLSECYNYTLMAYQAEKKKLESGKSTSYYLVQTSRALAEAEVELAETPEQVFAALESDLKRRTELLAATLQRLEVGTIAPLDQKMAEDACNAARIDLLRAKRQFRTGAAR